MPTRFRTAASLATILALLVAACGDDDTPDTEPGTFPLLGTTGEVPDHPALAVKVDNTEAGRPQVGLSEADIVYEEMVEGGLTRLVAVYHSDEPDLVGPVRSARSTDLALLAELGRPLFAWSGANPTVAGMVDDADIVDVGRSATPDAYEQAADRSAPYNLDASPADLRAAAGDAGDGGPPAALFDYRADDDPLTGPGVEDLETLRPAGNGLSIVIEWTWDDEAGRWLRTQDGTPHVDRDGERIGAANVVVRVTPYRDTGTRDAAGSPVPEAVAEGEGDVVLLSGGRSQPGTWHRASPDSPVTYTDLDGNPLLLAPGPTWIEVLEGEGNH